MKCSPIKIQPWRTLLQNPFIAVNAKKNATILSAYILEAGVNHLWNELKLKRDLELEITDGLFVGHAWKQSG